MQQDTKLDVKFNKGTNKREKSELKSYAKGQLVN